MLIFAESLIYIIYNRKKENQTFKSSRSIKTGDFVECFNEIIKILIADKCLFQKRIK